ncbi:MAG: outer membrane beta-barrel protein [Bacteroidales bacterium]
MKPILYKTILLSLLFPVILQAQRFDAGLRGGIGASQIGGDDLRGYNKPGLYTGIYTSIDLTDRSRISLEINYIEKGSRKYARPDKEIYKAYKLMLNYVEIPIAYEYFLHENLSFSGGLSYGVLLNREDNEEDESGVIPDTKPFRNYELAVNLAAHGWINETWGIGIRHSLSIIPVRTYKDGDSRIYNTPYGPFKPQLIGLLRFFVTYQF